MIIIAEQIGEVDNRTGPVMEPLHLIKHDIWNFGAAAEAGFNIGHDNDNIYLYYSVRERNIRAVHTGINDPVYEDSCVEFFISFEGVNYYNIEANCIGTVLAGYGKSRADRILLEKDLVSNIRTYPSLGFNKITVVDRETVWSLGMVIPIEVLRFTEPEPLAGKTATCNFYKCGDKQARVHYLSWNPVRTDSPDFHRPEYFAKLMFR